MKNAVCIMVILVACMGCHLQQQKKVIAVDSMKVIMWDMLKADELYLRKLGKDSTLRAKKENIRLYEEVFALHGITKKEFDGSFKYYESHPIEFKVLIDSVDAFSIREKEKILSSSNHGQAH